MGLCGIGILPMIHGLEAHATVGSSARIKLNPYDLYRFQTLVYDDYHSTTCGVSQPDRRQVGIRHLCGELGPWPPQAVSAQGDFGGKLTLLAYLRLV